MDKPHSTLTLGWRTDDEGHPSYWMRAGAKAGGHTDDDVVVVQTARAAKHTCIIAQSGSGKSYLLGRLIEEILLNTRANVFIFDPNADFRSFDQINPAVWQSPGYNPQRFLGSLPTEKSPESVQARWGKIPIRIFRADISEPAGNQLPMTAWWPDLSMGLFSEDLDPGEAVELRHCHTFVQALATLTRESESPDVKTMADSNRLLDRSQEVLSKILVTRGDRPSRSKLRERLMALFPNQDKSGQMNHTLDRAAMAAQFVSPAVARYYFGRAQECQIAGVLRSSPISASEELRSAVFDLHSQPHPELRQLAAYHALVEIWRERREAWNTAMARPAFEDRRVPWFVVVDEAHNLMPAKPRSRGAEVVREHFRTIAAEGRKFGLFLIVVSQRPDKLDPMILSECENKLVMRVDSIEVLGKIRESLGVTTNQFDQLAKCASYRIGRGLLFGAWAPDGPTKFMSAARRTVEGGRNLNPAWWGSISE